MRGLSSSTVLGQSGHCRSLPPLPRIFTEQPARSNSLISICAAS